MKQLITFLSLLGAAVSPAQIVAVGPFTISPANPTVNDQVLVITQTTISSMGNKISQSQSTAGTYSHTLRGCYFPGMLPALQVYTDTFNLGVQPAGQHFVRFVARASGGQATCAPVDSSAATVTFTVSGVTTGIRENADIRVQLWPNPVSELLYVSATAAAKRAELLDVTGRLVQSQGLNATPVAMELGALVPGMYILRVYNSEGRLVHQARVAKE